MPAEPQAHGSPADFGTRFSAFMIDAALLLAVLWVTVFVLSRQFQAAGLTAEEPCSGDPTLLCHGPSTALRVGLIMLVLLVTVGYHAVFEGLRAATPGKFFMGLSVVGIDGQAPIGLGLGIVRSIVRQSFWLSLFVVLDVSPISPSVPLGPFFIIPALALAGIVFGAIAPSGRAVHDLAASTVVVHTPDTAASQTVPPLLPVSEDSP